jgi:protein Tex
MTIDLGQLAREVELPVEQVQTVVELLDAGNTVPFIARFRKDQTGGLDETQVSRIQDGLIERRHFADRKEAVLRAIESQGKLSDELRQKIEQTHSIRRLEDLFLPFKPKKPTLGSLAKERGLEPLGREILHASPAAANLDARAADFVNPDRELASPAEVVLGVGHFLAEHFSEHPEVRSQLRKTFWRTAKIVCKPGEAVEELKEMDRQSQAEHEAAKRAAAHQRKQESSQKLAEAPAGEAPNPPEQEAAGEAANPANDLSGAAVFEIANPIAAPAPLSPAGEIEQAEQAPSGAEGITPTGDSSDLALSGETAPDEVEAPAPESPETAQVNPDREPAPAASNSRQGAVADHLSTRVTKVVKSPIKAIAAQALARKKAKDDVKRRKRQKAVQTFRDFFDVREPLKQLTPQRILSINRGERLRVLSVEVETDLAAMQHQAEELVVPADHPHRDFLQACVRDAVARLIVPSLVQEARRELNDRAELYAIEVYSQNLRNLLLQKPIRGRRILAIEPGFRKGCKIAAVDEAGRVLGVGMLQVVGREDWRKKGRERLVEIIRKHHVSIVAIGDDPGSREVERLVTEALEHDLKDAGVEYTIVPEAGAAAYGASPLAREELSKYDPSHRVAISIARRLLDPLAELVKVGPSNIEVGPAHYDVKTKLLRERLEAVLESVVCQVGVDVNRANPALLRYVSGMNQLTARRVYEFREHYGPLRNREQLKDIPGIDEKVYRQAAGFMKITGGENPLDATWIHPECYEAAHRVLDVLGLAMENVAPPPPKPKAFAEEVLAETPPPPAETPAFEPMQSEATAAIEDHAIAGQEAPPVSEAVSLAATGELPQESSAPETAEVAATASDADAAGVETATAPAEVPATPASAAATPEVAHSAAAPVPLPAEVPHNEEVESRSADWDLAKKAEELGIGRFTLGQILTELARPGRDPRHESPALVLRARRMSLDDMQPGMELHGVVVSVVDFGAFVDIGLPESGLVHISRLANRFVRHAHDEVAVGDPVRVWVVEVDKNRNRVSLTAVEPGTERQREDRRERPKKEPQKRERSEGQPQGQGRGGERPPRRQRRDQGKKGPRAPRQPSVYVVQSKKPAKPISKKMIEGKEPLRSFSDLQQFMQKKKTEGEEGDQPST